MTASLTRRQLLGSAAIATTASAGFAPAAEAAIPAPAGGGASVVGDEIWLNVRATAPARVCGRLWHAGHLDQMITTPWHATNRSNAARIPVPQAVITSGDWQWQGVVQDQQGLQPPVVDSVRRVPAWPDRGVRSAFAFAFGSCIIHSLAAPVLPFAATVDPKFFAIIGDMDYVDFDGTQDYARWSNAFRRFMNNPDAAPLIAKTAVMGMQDDHDYGLDGCYANTWKQYTAEAFSDVVPGAQYPDTSYRRWSIGDADIWMLDCRRYKDPKGGPYENGHWMSVIRQTQRNWLLDGLAGSGARIKVVLSPMPFGYYWSHGEQSLVKQWIASKVTGTVLFCSGDRHQTAFVHPAANFWELLACPINNPKKTVAYAIADLVWVEHPGARATSNAVGVVEIDTQKSSPTVTLRAITDNGSTLHAQTISV
jgi:hypothetical protein